MSAQRRSVLSGKRLALLLAAVAATALAWRLFSGPPADRRGMGGGAAPVRVAEALAQDVPQFCDGLGTVQASSDVLVRSRVDGQLRRLYFREGQRVKAGDPLAEIDPRPFEAQLNQARGTLARDQAQLENARKDLTRYARLAKGDFIARQEYETQYALVRQYEGTVTADKAAVEAARLQLEYSHVTAPASGRLGLRAVDVGNMIRASDADGIVRITETTPCDVVFTLPEPRIPLVTAALREGAGQPLRVQAWDRERKILLEEGVLLSLDNRIDTSTGTIKCKARFANSEEKLYPNQFVNARLLVRILRGAVTVPAAAVQTGVHGPYLFVVHEDDRGQARAQLREVTPAPDTGSDTLAVIESGLTAGERVVVDGVDRLRDGSMVTVAAEGTTPAAERF